MTKLPVYACLFGFFLFASGLPADDQTTPSKPQPPIYCGGGGPQPMVDVSAGLVADIKAVKTPDGLQDFVVLENSNAIVYRSEKNDMVSASLAEDTTKVLGRMDMPISRIVDPKERYLVSDGSSYLFDMKDGTLTHFAGPTGPVEHLFWYTPVMRELLFSLSSQIDPKGYQDFQLFNYSPHSDHANSCSFSFTSDYRLAKGNAQPDLIFYKEEPYEAGRLVTLVHISRDTLTGICWKHLFKRRIYVPISMDVALEDLYAFSSLGAVAFKFDHPEKSLVWWDGSDIDPAQDACQIYNIHNKQPIFLNDTQPVVATWSEQHGLNLYFFKEKAQPAKIAQLPIAHVDSHFLWLNRAGEKLYVSPDGEAGLGRREVIQFTLKTTN